MTVFASSQVHKQIFCPVQNSAHQERKTYGECQQCPWMKLPIYEQRLMFVNENI